MQINVRVKRIRDLESNFLDKFSSCRLSNLPIIPTYLGSYKNRILPLGVERIKNLIKDAGLVIPEDLDVSIKENTSGSSVAKRIEKWNAFSNKKDESVKLLSRSVISSIGQIADEHSFIDKDLHLYYCVHNGPFNWDNSEFGYHVGKNSCWWPDRKNTFYEIGGKAVLFYSKSTSSSNTLNKIGRLWAYQIHKDYFVVFNGYYNSNRRTHLLADLLHLSMNCEITAINSEGLSGNKNLYLNNEPSKLPAGYVLHLKNVKQIPSKVFIDKKP